jgi:hypothetical protein
MCVTYVLLVSMYVCVCSHYRGEVSLFISEYMMCINTYSLIERVCFETTSYILSGENSLRL